MHAAAAVQLGHIYWVGFRTIVIREYGRIMRIWGQTLVPSAVSATLYFVIFGHVVGRRISLPGGLNYAEYIAPGLIMMAIITNSYGNVVSSFFGAKFGKHVEELLVSPLPNWLIITGYAAGGLVRGALVGLVVSGVSVAFTGGLPVDHLAVIFCAALLTCAAFSLAGFINAMFARNFEQMNIVPTFILTPLTYFGGVFYSVNMLPSWAHRLSLFNPILYMVSAFRYGFFGIADVDVWLSLALVAALVLALFLTALVLMNRGTGIRD
ncbi:MAG TPA: ABC transporter permease [Steroidobacteraceae bacterium]|nr:ABC transporter permease [Steroidobacteraceae bacterium]